MVLQCHQLKCVDIDENLPHLSGIPDFLFARCFLPDIVTVTLVFP